MRARVLVSIAVAASIAVGTAGCEFLTEAGTTKGYNASDGVSTSVGAVDVRNALLLTKNGKRARLVASLVNNADSKRTVTIEPKDHAGQSVTVVIPGNSSVDLGSTSPTAQEVVFPKLDSKAGSLARVYFTYSGASGKSISVPVLNGAMEEYRTLLPTPQQSQTPTLTPTPTSTATPVG
ncbi:MULTISPECIES: hypothetical protein [unclassified Curtobacterium]|uniref:hypothetical protein n=1 Tax=unclassified Curtobacterium TaxID=257496 RepID=UPI0011B3E760|nr:MULTISPECIES: hypothetical protein [unclassified Curtobacterium]WIB63251.1 hypothetical protein DEI94_14035 [Curtobacterium sp. MCBD17_040]